MHLYQHHGLQRPDTTALLCSHHLHCSADLHVCDLSDTPSCYAIIIFIVLLIFMFVTYTTSSKIGNIGVMYNNLTEVARLNPVAGNRGGSYLTFWSIAGLKFGVLQTISCWGTLHRKEQERRE